MRTGVILVTSSRSNAPDRLEVSLRAKDIPILQCGPDDVDEDPETIRDFIVENRLETAVVSNLSSAGPLDSLRHALEEAGLGRLAISWIDLPPLLGEQPSGISANAANMILLNVARLQRADHIRKPVFRAMNTSSKISRRDLLRSIPRVLRVESDIPIVLADSCRDRSKSCNYCVRACPVDAVSGGAGAVMINDRLCIECGACARDCPIGAIQSPLVSDVQIVAMLNALASEELEMNRRVLVLTCAIGFKRLLDEGRNGNHFGAGIVPVEIPCVSYVGSVHYLWSASVGVELVTVCPDTSCKKAVAVFPLFQHAASFKNMLKALKRDWATSVCHLGLHANHSIVDFVSRVILPTYTVGDSVKLSEGLRREVTVDAIRALRTGSSGVAELPADGTLPLFDLKVDDARCVFCESCQKDCPDHAIEFTKSEDAFTLVFNPALCGGCMICEKNCPEKAISISGLTELSPILERKAVARAEDENAKCANCGTSVGSKRNLASLKKRLLEQGVTEAATKTLDLCVRCKQSALIRPLGRHLQV